jgi:hypothetical protein
MITRYLNNRWWKMKESPDGQYVAYHDHEAQIEKLRYEKEKLWERIAQMVEENNKLLDSATTSHVEIMELRKILKHAKIAIILAFSGLAYVWWGIWH